MMTRGFTRIELLVVLGIIVVLAVYAAFVLQRARTGALSAYDASQLSNLHKANVLYGNDAAGRYMIPGLVDRLPFELRPEHLRPGGHPSGMGPEDHSLNTTPNVYSALIGQNIIAPPLVVGPTEVNPIVRIKEDYDYDAYDPMNDSYWDSTFRVELDSPGGQAHASYAHVALGGLRKTEMWRNTQSADQPVFSNRSPRNGAESGPAYDESLTLRLHGSKHEWIGNVCFNDNHVDTLKTFRPGTFANGNADPASAVSDNIFAAEFDAKLEGICSEHTNPELAGDAFLLIYDAIEFWPAAERFKRVCPRSFRGRFD